MSTNKHTYTLTVHTAITREWFAASGLDGSSFPEMRARSFESHDSAVNGARSILAALYDPRVPLAAQPVVQISDGYGLHESFTEVPYVGFRECDAITADDMAKSAERGDGANRESCAEYAATRFGMEVVR